MKKIIDKVKRVLKTSEAWKAIVAAVCMAAVGTPTPVFAATGDYLSPLKNLKTIMLNILSVAGGIIVIWGIFRFGQAFQKHDQNAEYQGIFTIVAGVIMVGAGVILTALGV